MSVLSLCWGFLAKKVTESKRGSILTRFTTREPYPDHETKKLDNQS